jgi:hypothetical protein
MMQVVLWVAAIGVALFGLDRLALWAETKGWIYWRKKKAQTGALGSALMEMNVITNPSAEHVIVVKDAKKFEERENGDDDPPR